MSKHCPCREIERVPGERLPRQCLHLVPSAHDPLITPAELLTLEPYLSTLVDAADAFDTDCLVVDQYCEVHGTYATSNATCTCSGERFSAVEFVQALVLDIRAAATVRSELARSHMSDARVGRGQLRSVPAA